MAKPTRCWICGQYVASRDGLSEESASASPYAEERDAYITEKYHLCPGGAR
jgi:hypothetical protein